jgi:hypothetical protein
MDRIAQDVMQRYLSPRTRQTNDSLTPKAGRHHQPVTITEEPIRQTRDDCHQLPTVKLTHKGDQVRRSRTFESEFLVSPAGK